MKDSLSKDNELIELQELQERIKKLQLERDILISDIDIKKYTEDYENMTLEEQNEFRLNILEELEKKNNLIDKLKNIYSKSK